MTKRATRDDQIALIERVIREISWHSQKHAIHTLTRADINLTVPQLVTLFAISSQGTCRMSDLADLTQQSAGTLTGIVDRLIDDGLVARARNANDRRVVEVMLTPEGEDRLHQALKARMMDMRRVLAQFGDDDLKSLSMLLQRFLAGVHADLGADEISDQPD